MSALESSYQKEIDGLTTINDSIKTANDRLINKLQEQIDADRRARENEKTEKDLSKLYN
jgi:hypothetical protein